MTWGWLWPWRAREQVAHREAQAACMETALVKSRRPLIERIAYELGQHRRDNHFVDIIQAVARGHK